MANSSRLAVIPGEEQHFPSEGLFFGNLSNAQVNLPALFNLNRGKEFCIMYGNPDAREKANRCLERLAWRLALTVPANLCDIVLFNGGRLGDAFDTLSRINQTLCSGRKEKVYYDGNLKEFAKLLENIYAAIANRMASIRIEGKDNLYELNTALGSEATIKYQFIILTDFPNSLTPELGVLLYKIIESGSKAGIYVLMSWDVNADFSGSSSMSNSFDTKKMLSALELVVPKNGRYYLKNSIDDNKLNQLNLTLDSSSVDYATSLGFLDEIDARVKHAIESAKPKILKQDFEGLKNEAYSPVCDDLNIAIGKDVHDKHSVSRYISKCHSCRFLI